MFPNSNASNSYNPFQQKGCLNVIVFDQDDSINNSQRYSQSAFKIQNSYQNLTQSRNAKVIHKQIQTLQDKLKSLENQTERLANQLSYRKTQTNFTEITKNQIHNNPQYDELISIIQKKIQIIIKQTQTIVSKITQNFQKKLQDKNNNPQSNFSLNIASYQSQSRRKMIETVRQLENKYQHEIQKLKHQNRQIQTQMLMRVNAVEESYALKILDFQRKQRNYVDQIQQLQIKYRKLQNSRSQKKLEVTQDRDRSFTKKNNQNNRLLPDNINQSKSRQNNLMIPPALRNQTNRSQNTRNDTSASRNRKHKIFDLKKDKRQTSPVPTNQPANRSPSPISYSENSNIVNYNYGNFQKIKNTNNPTLTTVQPIQARRLSKQQLSDNYDYNNKYDGNFQPGQKINTNLYQTNLRPSHEKQQKNQDLINKNQMQSTPTASQFYRDIPKANSGWQKIQNGKNKRQQFNNSSSQQDEDVFFYADNPDQQQKFLSPLDIN